MLGVLIMILILFAIILIIYSNSIPTPTTNRFTGTLNGTKVIPPTSSNAIGNFSGQIFGDQLEYNLIVNSISDAPIGYIGHGHSKSNGRVLKILHFKPVNNLSGAPLYQSKGIWKKSDPTPLTESLIKELSNGNLYVQVANNVYEDGEIRSQIRRLI